ncbi:hypothetical protein ABT071_13815 [Streptomyces sp. NPDC002506]|uniref:hypothetical protein n=1 Tax=Streptomyces sp. NPDC002506 TaxID=3154536 RepID=UPI0033290A00
MISSGDEVTRNIGFSELFRMLEDPATAEAACDAFLEHGLDVSGYVDALAAFRSPQVAQPRRSRAPHRALGIAASLAGRRRVHLRDEWAAVLAGDPANGLILTQRQRLRLVVGFLFAAIRFRIHDALGLLWAPVDWVLTERSRSETLIALTVGAQVIYIAWNDGMHALLTEGWGWCGGCGGALYLLTRWLRRLRGIELAAVRPGNE